MPIERKVRVVAELEARTGPAAEIAERHGVSRTAPYLSQCVDSILAHNYDSIDIVLLDDGSTDVCPALCDLD